MRGRRLLDLLVPGETEHDLGAPAGPVDHQVRVAVVEREHGADHRVGGQRTVTSCFPLDWMMEDIEVPGYSLNVLGLVDMTAV